MAANVDYTRQRSCVIGIVMGQNEMFDSQVGLVSQPRNKWTVSPCYVDYNQMPVINPNDRTIGLTDIPKVDCHAVHGHASGITVSSGSNRLRFWN